MPHSLPPQKKTNSASTAFRTFIMRGVPTRGGRATKLSGLTPLTCAGEDVLILDSQNEHPVNGIIWSLHRGHRMRYSTFLDDWSPSDICLDPRPVLLSNQARPTRRRGTLKRVTVAVTFYLAKYRPSSSTSSACHSREHKCGHPTRGPYVFPSHKGHDHRKKRRIVPAHLLRLSSLVATVVLAKSHATEEGHLNAWPDFPKLRGLGIL